MKNNLAKPYFLSFIVPFWGLIIGLKNISDKSFHFFILFFAFWYGYSIIFIEGADHTQYKETYSDVEKYDLNDYTFLVTHALSIDRLNNLNENTVNNKPDLFALSLMFLITRITDNPRWFFAFVSLIYFFLFLSFKSELLKYTEYARNKYFQVIFLFILLILPFHVGVTGVRFWTALFYVLWVYLKFLNNKKKRDFILLLWISVLIHYSFAIPCLLISIFINFNFSAKFIKPFLPILFLLYFLSAATSLTYISSFLNVFEETSVKESAETYTDKEYLNERKLDESSTNWYVRVREFAINNLFIIFYLLELSGFVKFKNNNNNSIDMLTFVFFILTLLTSGLGSIGRFKYLFYILGLIRLLKIIKLDININIFKKYYTIFSLILILHVLVSNRGAFYSVDPLLVVGHPLLFLFDIHSTTSLSEILVGH